MSNRQQEDPADKENAREMESKLRDLRAQYDALKAEHPSLTVARAEMVAPPHEMVVALLRAERDALKAQVEAHAHDLGSLRSAVHDALPLDYPDGLLIKQVSVMGAELVRLRRQVEAARALCRDQLDHGQVEADDLAGRILDAMDDVVR